MLVGRRWSRSRSSGLSGRDRPRTAHSASGPPSVRWLRCKPGSASEGPTSRRNRYTDGRKDPPVPPHPLRAPPGSGEELPKEDRAHPAPPGPHAPCGAAQPPARPWPRPGPAHLRTAPPAPANHRPVRARGGGANGPASRRAGGRGGGNEMSWAARPGIGGERAGRSQWEARGGKGAGLGLAARGRCSASP